MRDTPRTDAEESSYEKTIHYHVVGSVFARQLERELNTALKRIKELERELSGRDPIVDAELASLTAFANRGCK